MYKRIHVVAAIGAACLAIGLRPAAAQGWSDTAPAAPPAAVAESAQAIDPALVSGPTIYVVDINRHLATINLGTGAVHIVGTTSPTLTDIAFNPANHALYGVTFSAFYEINKANGATRYIGSLDQNDANSLVFNSSGVGYSAGVNTGDLYRIDVFTGRASVVGSTGGYGSAGDLAFYNDQLILSGFHGLRNIYTTTPNYLVTLNEKTGGHEGNPVLLPIKEVFGLVSTGKNELYGLALDGKDAGLYRLVPTEAITSKRAVLLENLSSKGLGQILGAAYDGNYQP